MRIVTVLAFYGLALYLGFRHLWGKERKLSLLWYGGILAWCAYVHISGITGARHLSIASIYLAFFQPVGKVIIQWLGG